MLFFWTCLPKICCNARNTKGESVVGGVSVPPPPPPSPLKTVYNFQVDSTLDVGSSALSSRLAAAHTVMCEWSAHQEALQTCLGYFCPKGKQVELRGVAGDVRRTRRLPGHLWKDLHL